MQEQSRRNTTPLSRRKLTTISGCRGRIKPITMQTRRLSLIESITQTAIGFIVSLAVQAIIYPLMDIPVTISQNIVITAVFTIVSIIRGYLIRRWYERRAR